MEEDTLAANLVLIASFLNADGQLLEYGVDLGAPGRTRRTTWWWRGDRLRHGRHAGELP